MHSLPLFHRIAGTRVVVTGDEPMAGAKRRLVERAGGIPCPEEEADKVRIAFVAIDDDDEAEATASRLRAKGLLVNVADRPDLCDFTTPSMLDRDPVIIAIATGGASAGLAKHLRLRIEQLLPHTLGLLAARLAGSRDAIRQRWTNPDMRRFALDNALAQGGPLDPLDPGSAQRVAGWVRGDSNLPHETVHTFRLRSTDPEELTLRQARLLGTCDTLLHDPAIPPAILDRARADAVRDVLPAAPPEEGLTVILRLHQEEESATSPISAK
ncbi:siroheme synthase [Erythrobacter sp. 3-20A1M]|uniref:precorrin-2 dehydrogenase/sirohydrochlorin ferrochelatase family protein n=1 Tax=Erythrobacter sp. 3-20A1M TaxID=2653850 RepID=UPI001BFC9B30|nr:bifunctional precorrin-2 dehydrogenase/sirohydrochlorin ferrochelatase [Erythrobacter sp. 3-20A1M]QWC56153.1 siroheme synthase [Erythrobacter sp. 3-20A1M]